MDLVDELRAFVATAQTGSFTAAADQLGVSNRLTSKYVAELEERLGVRLLQRTTRKVGLTPGGETLLAQAPALLDDLDELLADVSEESRRLSGTIRVSAPVTLGEVYISDLLGRFVRKNPGLTLDLRLGDKFVDLASEGIDLAFRLGRSDMLSLKARKLASFSSIVVASPAYLQQHDAPQRPEELAGHNCIIDTNRRNPRRWTFRRGVDEYVANVHGQFMVNSAQAAAGLARGGMGIAYVPRFALFDAVERGDLVPLLPDYDGETGVLNAVYLEGRALPRKVRMLIDFAAADIRSAELFFGKD